MRLLIEEQPSPSLLCDRHWHVLAYNSLMAAWWPWVTEPGANLLKWGLLDPEARVQHHQWRDHANRLIRLLKFALAGRRDDPELARLAEEVRTDPDVLRLWETTSEVAGNRDGHLHRMRVPALGWRTIELISHTLHPASLPDSRLIIFTQLQEPEHSELPARPRQTVPPRERTSPPVRTRTAADTPFSPWGQRGEPPVAGTNSLPGALAAGLNALRTWRPRDHRGRPGP
ncbi:MmyB family transcriptional regulator [Streptomyces niveus]|uniref:MmyB family transcriptional regulator n=1 Tax=Streptomyces niveus TaxID=193462 RepID=UPI00341CE939